MKPFRFRLDKVLGVRLDDRNQARHELARALQALQLLEGQREQLAEQHRHQQSTRAAEAAKREPRVEALIDGQRQELVTQVEIQQLAVQIQQVTEELERRRQILVEADREVKVLEKLRERKEQEHARQQARVDHALMDEIAGQRADRVRRLAE